MVKPLFKKEISTLDEIISKGGEVAADKQIDSKKWQLINLRIRDDLLQELDEKVKERIGISRTAWILEAIQEKLKKQNG